MIDLHAHKCVCAALSHELGLEPNDPMKRIVEVPVKAEIKSFIPLKMKLRTFGSLYKFKVVMDSNY